MNRRNALVVNCSQAANPAVPRLAAWLGKQGAAVTAFERSLPGDLDLALAGRVYLSAIYSWDLPTLAAQARRAQQFGAAVEIGGPATEHNADWVRRETGVDPWRGPHPCASVPVPNLKMAWSSRGCIRRCPFCIVWRVEGDLVELDDGDWQPAPLMMDNNFLACSEVHQERVVKRLADSGLRVDFNQGLDARLYTPAFRRLVQRAGLRLRFWRFACDADDDWPAVERALLDLRAAGVGWWDVRVYVLYGYRETPAEAVARAERVIGSRDEPLACPWPMAFKPLDWLERGVEYVAPGWTLRQLLDFRRYYSRPRLWRATEWAAYNHGHPRGVEARGYPADWAEIARRVKEAAGWRCEHCGAPHDLESGHVLTVHHLDGNPANCAAENLVALCQRCHLRWQNSWRPGQLVMDFARPEWMEARGLG